MTSTTKASQTPTVKQSSCTYCPVSELQLAVLLGESDPEFQPTCTEDIYYCSTPRLSGEAGQRLDILLGIYRSLRRAAPQQSSRLANRWVFEPGLLEPITDDSIIEYLLAEPTLERFNQVHRFLESNQTM